MSLILQFFFAYALAWWLVFWLPLRKTLLSPLCFIPAAIFAFGVPSVVSDVYYRFSLAFPMVWSALPFFILLAEPIGHAVVRARHSGSQVARQGCLP